MKQYRQSTCRICLSGTDNMFICVVRQNVINNLLVWIFSNVKSCIGQQSYF